MSYFVYMLLCDDGSYYLGSTNDVEKRFKVHVLGKGASTNDVEKRFKVHVLGKGASYTRSHKPLRVIYQEEVVDKSTALKREHELKKLTHLQKSRIINIL